MHWFLLIAGIVVAANTGFLAMLFSFEAKLAKKRPLRLVGTVVVSAAMAALTVAAVVFAIHQGMQIQGA